jgi:hypothetical protein
VEPVEDEEAVPDYASVVQSVDLGLSVARAQLGAYDASSRRTLPELPDPAEGYRVYPSPAALLEMTDDELRAVRFFTVYREGHGAVVWDRPVDLSAASGERNAAR